MATYFEKMILQGCLFQHILEVIVFLLLSTILYLMMVLLLNFLPDLAWSQTLQLSLYPPADYGKDQHNCNDNSINDHVIS